MRPSGLPAALTSMPARVLVACIGVALLALFGVFLIAALAHMPATWIGVVYSMYGIAAALMAFRYAAVPNRTLLFLMAPAAVLMVITVSGVVP
jgi:uncharacterized membrane protein YuzA (DUF378 family)